jgi:NAD(P)-dependent dehydrogenase (short-subunit alcohol dehydrogenase family)
MALTKAMANEFAPHNVLVNAMLVGIIESDQWVRRHASEQRNISWEEWKAEQGKAVPLGRIGKAEEFAAMALLLASDQGGFISGTAINVDGGKSPVV